ncbi:hypothetical protein KDE13_09350 [Campylobacter sp. faydin G-140]|uniref:hypothetical protein n=1 Tax=Campylobacter anatolicus TaxID=2829105 RepID=UPI001BA3AA16|nr:hypothetical protein [Campylobacter anatolicus]MBR8466539.1 hypothetical protein [Campylobacter anatolicus]
MLILDNIKCSKEVERFISKNYKNKKYCHDDFTQSLQEFADNEYALVTKAELKKILCRFRFCIKSRF